MRHAISIIAVTFFVCTIFSGISLAKYSITEFNVEVCEEDGSIQIFSYFDGDTRSDGTVGVIICNPDEDIIYKDSDTIKYLNITDVHKVYTHFYTDVIVPGEYDVIYIFGSGNESYVIMGGFSIPDDVDDDNIDLVFPMTYDPGDTKYNVKRYIAFSVVCIIVFVYIAITSIQRTEVTAREMSTYLGATLRTIKHKMMAMVRDGKINGEKRENK